MVDENEAFWAGMAIAIAILGSGFSMLFISPCMHAHTVPIDVKV